MRRLVAHKGWGGIYNGTSRQRGFGMSLLEGDFRVEVSGAP